VHGQHCHRHEAAQQTEGVEQFEQSTAFVKNAQIAIDAEGNALRSSIIGWKAIRAVSCGAG
jgi:hypothetical protein